MLILSSGCLCRPCHPCTGSMTPSCTAILLGALLLSGVSAVTAVPIIRTDSSPICNSVYPQCQAQCRQGEDYFFICSAGNGPNGGPYMICRCTAPAMPVGPPSQTARLVLDQASWPGSRACNEKTWLNDCTSQMTASVNGSSVLFTPSTSSAFNERCDPAPGVVLAPNGATAAVTFPQYPIGITSTGPDGTLTIDFSQTAADDPNQMDWSQCIVRYKIVQGTFLNPQLGTAAQQAALQALQQQQQGAGTTSGAADSRPRELLQLLIAMVGAAGLLLWL